MYSSYCVFLVPKKVESSDQVGKDTHVSLRTCICNLKVRHTHARMHTHITNTHTCMLHTQNTYRICTLYNYVCYVHSTHTHIYLHICTRTQTQRHACYAHSTHIYVQTYSTDMQALHRHAGTPHVHKCVCTTHMHILAQIHHVCTMHTHTYTSACAFIVHSFYDDTTLVVCNNVILLSIQ